MNCNEYFEAQTLDDLLNDVFKRLIESGAHEEATKGKFHEIVGAHLVIRDPRGRLSRSETKGKVFSALGELFWYLSRTNRLDFIEYYIKRYKKETQDNVTVRSGYGERLFFFRGQNQIENVIDLLKKKPSSRRAVVQLFDASDLGEDHKSIPCTCSLQFLIRSGKLHLISNMRSNDAFWGLPHDVFVFTMLQEIMARTLEVELGEYRHFVGSLHLYEGMIQKAEDFLSEGWQSPRIMSQLPNGDPWTAISSVSEFERQVRLGTDIDFDIPSLDVYWMDMCRILMTFKLYKMAKKGHLGNKEAISKISRLKSELADNSYGMFLDSRIELLEK